MIRFIGIHIDGNAVIFTLTDGIKIPTDRIGANGLLEMLRREANEGNLNLVEDYLPND